MTMLGKLFVNDDELQVTKSSSVAELKKASTMQRTEVRIPYSSYVSTFPRTWMICRTTNRVHNLYYSASGLRKFVPVIVKRIISKSRSLDRNVL